MKLKIWFNNVSLYKKILIIVFIALFCTYIAFFISIQFLTGRYDRELYQINAQALNHVSASITAELQAIEAISANVMSDSIIQENLRFLNQGPVINESALAKREIYNALYPHAFYDNYIKSITIILNDQTSICMGSTSYIKQFDEKRLNEKSQHAMGRLIWETARNPGSDVTGIRQIRDMKYLKLDKLGDLYIIIDMERLISDSLKNAGYSPDSSGFLLSSEESRIYPESSEYDGLYYEIIDSMNLSGENYAVSTVDDRKVFVISGSLPYADWDYLYFRDYNPIFEDILSAKFQVLSFSFICALLALALVQTIVSRILKHLELLVNKIQNFGSGKPVSDTLNYNYKERQDEIGQLHRSFDQMTRSVKVLRDENYDKQLLLRDATIKMLQQQINPHFLYNTLDTINCMAQKYGADDISTMICSLSNLFRYSITDQNDLIPLSDELKVLNNYIRIQEIRFKDRLNFKLISPDDVSHIQVPKLCIQPLVENALKHAMEYSDEMCTIRVSIKEQLKDCKITVANTGSQFEDDLLWKIEHNRIIPNGSGVGLVNIDSRLKLLYGDHYGLKFYNKDGMAVVMLIIPKEREVSNAEINDRR